MRTHSRIGRAITCGALAGGLVAGPLTFAGGAAAQTAPPVLNAPPANMSNHDAALDAAHRGDYVAALDFAKKAAADGQPLDPDQVDFISGKAAKQQADLDAAAKIKAAQAAAQANASQIMDRQQKDYAKRERAARLAADDEPTAAQAGMQGQLLGGYAQSFGGAQSQTMHVGGNYQANGVNSSVWANNRPVNTNGYRPAYDCLSVAPDGSKVMAANKCDYKVLFVWCADGVTGARACAPGGGVPAAARSEIEAHGRLAISELDSALVRQQSGYQWVAGLKVHTWACEAPSAPQASSAAGYDCK